VSTYRKTWDCCGDTTETDAWEPEACPFCAPAPARPEPPKCQNCGSTTAMACNGMGCFAMEGEPEPPTAAGVEPRFLLVSMDDDGKGWPVFCKDEAAVSAALLPLMFFLQDGETLDADHAEQFKGNLESLLEDGFLNFEGDPSIHLYRLHAGRAAAAGAGS